MTFLVDTNVVSEMRKAPSQMDAGVAGWGASAPARLLHLSVVSLFELDRGAGLLERRDPAQGARIRRWIDERVIPSYGTRILPVDVAIARRAAELHVPDPKPVSDSLIAATALAHGLVLVTRNERDFRGLGIDVLNPFTGPRT